MKSLIFIILILIFFSCEEKMTLNYFDNMCGDTSRFEVDTSKNSLIYSTKATNEFLSIKLLSEPSDTFFLRIDYSTDSTIKIFEYSFYKQKSVYKIYTFPVEKNGKILFNKEKQQPGDFVKVINYNKNDSYFIDKLKQNKILDFVSKKGTLVYKIGDSTHNQDIADGFTADNYTIEYSNRCKYSLKIFENITINSKKIPEAKLTLNFIKYLKEEFKF